MLIAGDERYYSLASAALAAIHLANPELSGYLATPRNSVCVRVDGPGSTAEPEGEIGTCPMRSRPFRSGSRFIRARVRDYAALP